MWSGQDQSKRIGPKSSEGTTRYDPIIRPIHLSEKSLGATVSVTRKWGRPVGKWPHPRPSPGPLHSPSLLLMSTLTPILILDMASSSMAAIQRGGGGQTAKRSRWKPGPSRPSSHPHRTEKKEKSLGRSRSSLFRPFLPRRERGAHKNSASTKQSKLIILKNRSITKEEGCDIIYVCFNCLLPFLLQT